MTSRDPAPEQTTAGTPTPSPSGPMEIPLKIVDRVKHYGTTELPEEPEPTRE